MDRYLLIDPTGINLVFKPQGEAPSLAPGFVQSSGTTITGNRVTGASEPLYEFTAFTLLTESDWAKLSALARSQDVGGRPDEVVVYWVFDKHHDMGTQTREALPGVPVETDGEVISYYPVIQGFLSVTGLLFGQAELGAMYAVQLDFTEGTIRRP